MKIIGALALTALLALAGAEAFASGEPPPKPTSYCAIGFGRLASGKIELRSAGSYQNEADAVKNVRQRLIELGIADLDTDVLAGTGAVAAIVYFTKSGKEVGSSFSGG